LLVRPFRHKKLLEKAAYYRRMAYLWLFTILWLAAFVAALLYLDSFGGWTALGVFGLLFLTAPERRELMKGYATYLEEWRRDNE
jgi:hypothetical protein